MKYEELMKLDKDTLATKLVNKNSGGHRSPLIPISRDGIKMVTLGQEAGLVNAIFERPRGYASPADHFKNKDYGGIMPVYIENVLSLRESLSSKLIVGSTVLGFIGNAFKRKGSTVRAGIFKLN